MPKMTNERRMQQALRIIQTWAHVASEKYVNSVTYYELRDICNLAERTLANCDEHDAKQKGRTTK